MPWRCGDTLRFAFATMLISLPWRFISHQNYAVAILIGATLCHALAPLRYADHRRCYACPYSALPLRCCAVLSYAVAVQRMSCRCLSVASRFFAKLCHRISTHVFTMPLRFTARLCHTVAGLVRAYRSLCVSLPCLSMPWRFVSFPHLALQYLRDALPSFAPANLFHAVQYRGTSMLFNTIASLCSSMLCRCFALLYDALPCLCDVLPCITIQYLCIASLFNSIAMPSLAAPLHILASTFNAVAFQPLLPPMTLPVSSSSSHKKRPIPEFRHWPIPLYLP